MLGEGSLFLRRPQQRVKFLRHVVGANVERRRNFVLESQFRDLRHTRGGGDVGAARVGTVFAHDLLRFLDNRYSTKSSAPSGFGASEMMPTTSGDPNRNSPFTNPTGPPS